MLEYVTEPGTHHGMARTGGSAGAAPPIAAGTASRLASRLASWLASGLDCLLGPRRGRALPLALATAILLSLPGLFAESPTYDEPYHLAAGYTNLVRGDYRLGPDHPPLLHVIAALPLLAQQVHWPADESLWQSADIACFAHALFYQSGNDPDRLLRSARLVALAWVAIVQIVVFTWARALFGPDGGLVALVLATFCPTLLAHGHLVTTDVGMVALALLTLRAFSRLAARPTWSGALSCGALLGAALVAKFSAVFLLPAIVAAHAVSWWLARAAGAGRDASSAAAHAVGWRRRLLLVSSVILGAYLIVWGAYGFRYRPSPDPTFRFDWAAVEHEPGALVRAVTILRDHRLLPEAYLYGFALTEQRTRDRASYALGRFSPDGWWWYFPFALLVKTPVATLLLYAWGLGALVRRGAGELARACHLVVPLAVYWIVAVSTPLNIGVRHMLPAMPMMMILTGGLAARPGDRAPRWRGRALAALLAMTAAACLAAAPYFIPFFNLPSRLVFARHYMLADSNLDWGQDLRRLRRYMDQHGIAAVKLSYFGSASPAHLGLAHEMLTSANVYLMCEQGLVTARDLRPGDYVAIGATNLVGASFPEEARDELARFRAMEPVATIGHSIMVYRMPTAP
jgi:4-amino-4-deoxy-L-arabinose transferase-like glycosyltransferase